MKNSILKKEFAAKEKLEIVQERGEPRHRRGEMGSNYFQYSAPYDFTDDRRCHL
jgi:hypothetical protein